MVLSIEAVPAAELSEALQRLPGWKVDGKSLCRTEAMPTYRAALDLVRDVGECAEEFNHHPDITMKYKTVTVAWWTHKIGGISRGDLMMAERVSVFFERRLK